MSEVEESKDAGALFPEYYLLKVNNFDSVAKTPLDEWIESVFDQTNKDGNNRQVLNIDEDAYRGDAEMEHILHRLLAEASDSKLRQDMNVEDEYFSQSYEDFRNTC